jgi:Chaperone of endosialidase
MSSKGGSKNTPTQTVVQSSSLPGYIQTASSNNIDLANNIAARPFEANPYNKTLTPFNQDQNNALGMLRSSVGQTAPVFQSAVDAATRAGNINPGTVSAQNMGNGLAAGDLQKYLNPFTQNVIDTSAALNRQTFAQNLNDIGDKSIAQSAFGGSRQGVAEGVAASQNALGMANLNAQLQGQNFQQATGLMNSDIQNNLAAQVQNQNSAINQQKGLTASALGLGQLGQAQQSASLQDAQTLSGVGDTLYGLQSGQQNLDASNWQANRDYPLEQLNIRMGAVANSPYSTTSTSTTYGGNQNQGLSGLGGALTGLNIGRTLGQGFGLTGSSLGMASGAGSLIGGLLGFSDERAKTDIEKVGRDKATGLNIYAYRYKSDPKTYPKVVGVMAQEVQKKYPGRAREVGGKLAVNGLRGL